MAEIKTEEGHLIRVVSYQERIHELEEKNKGLTARLNAINVLTPELEKLSNAKTKRIKELEAQIEKMKCWCNCQNWKNCLFECAEKGKKFEKEFCFGCPKWQLDVKKLEKVRRKKMTNNEERAWDKVSDLEDKVKRLEEQIEKMKSSLEQAVESANRQEQWEVCSVLKDIYKDCFEGDDQ